MAALGTGGEGWRGYFPFEFLHMGAKILAAPALIGSAMEERCTFLGVFDPSGFPMM